MKGNLLAPRVLHPKSMLRPEELASLVSQFPKTRITMHAQIITSLWVELDRHLYPSEAYDSVVARIKEKSGYVRRIAGLPKPRPEPETQSSDKRVRLKYHHSIHS